jgi:hypothetical protein
LNNYEEIIGMPTAVSKDDDILRVLFNLQVTLDIPFSEELYDKLRSCIGKKIGLINADGEFRIYDI